MIAWSAGWGTRVELGPGQELVLGMLRAAVRHPSRTWHRAPRMREYGRSPATAHRHIHRLAALGVIAVQTVLGCDGETRFTFGVSRWLWRPPVRRNLVRMRRGLAARVAPGQLALAHAELSRIPNVLPSPMSTAPWTFGDCALCGARDRVRTGLLKRTIDGEERIESGPRCADHEACDARRASWAPRWP
jgi:hypothetical protein